MSRTHEIIKGVEVDLGGDNSAIYFRDAKGEIVCWTYDEVKEDPEAWTASLFALAKALQEGLQAVRETTFFGTYTGSPKCKHEPDFKQVELATGYNPEVVVDVICKHCGTSGSWNATPKTGDINW